MTELILTGELQSFDEEKREVYGLIAPFGVDAETARGLECFDKGAFEGVDAQRIVLRRNHQDPPTGRGMEIEERDDGAYMRFKISNTAHGDEQLTLARDGVERGLSVGFTDGKFSIEKAGNRRRLRHSRVNLSEVSTTWQPAFSEAAVLQLREKDNMPETQEPVAEAPVVSSAVTTSELQTFQDTILSKIQKLEERNVALSINAPPAEGEKLTMQRKVLLQVRELAEVITTDNMGVVPDAFVNEMIGIIDVGRPFLNSTRRLTTPAAGINLLLPKITQRPIVGVQAAEKDELASQKTIISTVDFPMQTVGGAGDLSMQLIKRSSPEFLNLWLELLGQAYAVETEDNGLDALLAEATVVEGGALDPAAPQFGGAFTNAATATGRTMAPDRIWLSTSAIAAFGDALEPSGGGGRPLYPGIFGITGLAGGGSLPGGFNLQPVWVPALDDEAVDVIVGPSRGFCWAEDGTYVLQADVPAKFGRDVGLAGMIWYAPIYPAAFTSYTLES